MKKRIFSLVLALCIVVSMVPAAAAAGYEDTDGHWAEDAIARWSEYGIVEGNDGLFSPDAQLTRGQLAAIIARLLNLPEAGSAGFGDTDGHWAEDVINRCAAAGIMQGDGVNANPDKPISREETMVMLGRALGIKPVENADLSDYDDDHAVSGWAEGYVAAMTDKGIVNGIDGSLAPDAEIDRASTMTILNRAITTYANEPGQTVEVTEGIVVVAAANVTVTGEAAGVVVTQGAAGGTITLTNINVETVTVQAENTSVVVGENTAAVNVEVTQQATGTAVEVAKDAAVGTVTTAAAESTVSVSGTVGTVETTEQATGAAVEVTKTATVETVTTGAAAGTVTVSGTVSNVTVTESAAGTTVETEKGAKVENVTTEAESTTVTGSGTVSNVTTSGNNTSVETSGTKVEAAEGTTGTTAGDKVVEGGESTTTKPSTPVVPDYPVYVCTHPNAVERTCSTPMPMGCKEMYCPDCDTILSTTTCELVWTDPTCTEEGIASCKVCHSEYPGQNKPVLGHDFENVAWSSDETGHWHICARENCTVTDTKAAHGWLSNNCAEATECGTCGYDKAAGEHTWDAGKVTTAPTCTETGVKTFTCTTTGCGETKTEPVAETGHKYTTYVYNNDATCTVDGTKTAECDNDCGTTDTQADEGTAKGHKYTDYKSNNDATCTKDGTKTAACDNGCDVKDTVTDAGSAKGHSYTTYTTKTAATCENDRVEIASCDYNCGTTDEKTISGSKVAHQDGVQCEFCKVTEVKTAATLQSAAVAGGSVKVMANITTNVLITVPNGKEVTLDLNGCTISAAEDGCYIRVEEGGKLTVNATNGGGITNGNVYGYAIVNFGTLTVNGGTFVGEYALYNGDYSSATATATLNGGTFIAREGTYYSIANCSNMTVAGATIEDWLATSGQFTMTEGSVENLYANTPDKTVATGTNTKISGGTVTTLYVNENIPAAVTGGTFGNDPSAYVAKGYIAIEDAEAKTWTVTAVTKEMLPVALVSDADQYENVAIVWGNYGNYKPSNSNQQLESVYIFAAQDDEETVKTSPFAGWVADYYVSLNRDLEEGQLVLGGNYGSFGWVGFDAPGGIKANTKVPLLGSVGATFTYKDIVLYVKEFICGVADIGDVLAGATFTVELRLTNPNNAEDYYVINDTSYTFK